MIYQRLLGTPLVYDVVRPWFVGGIDHATHFARVDIGADDVVFDVGCGTGIALDYVPVGARYFGFDTDPIAIGRARERRTGPGQGTSLFARAMSRADVEREQPTLAMLVGVLHHLTDVEAIALLSALASSRRLRHIQTLDPTYLPGLWFNNLVTRCDRGRFTRAPEAYGQLGVDAGLELVRSEVIPASTSASRIFYQECRFACAPRSDP